MAEQGKSLEMRVAELEDKLSKVHVTEEEMKTYQKVSALMGHSQSQGLSPQLCLVQCYRCIIYRCIINICICNECTCGPCIASGGGGVGGGFGGLGS
jgi:hypothetical protein